MLQYDLLMSTDQRINAHYMAAGALKDSRVMEALLGELPASHQMELQGFMLGLVHGTDVNARMRTDVVDSGFSTRVLVPNRTASVTARLYTGLTAEQLEIVRMFTFDGVITKEGTVSIGNDNEAVGEAKIHLIKESLPYEELTIEDREIFPNGLEGTIAAAGKTRRRFEERFHGPSPERR